MAQCLLLKPTYLNLIPEPILGWKGKKTPDVLCSCWTVFASSRDLMLMESCHICPLVTGRFHAECPQNFFMLHYISEPHLFLRMTTISLYLLCTFGVRWICHELSPWWLIVSLQIVRMEMSAAVMLFALWTQCLVDMVKLELEHRL